MSKLYRRLLSIALVSIALAAPLSAAEKAKEAKEAPTTLKRSAWGKVSGWVLDARTRKPVAGAKVVVEIDGAFPESGKSTDLTEQDGRFTARAPLGKRSSKFDWGRVLTMSPLSLLVSPRSVTKQTRIVDVLQVNVRAEAAGYKPFLGRVRAGVADAEDFEITLDDIWLAPEQSELVSFTPERMRVEAVDNLRVEPAVVAPGEKVRITLTAILPVNRGYRYRGYATSSSKRLIKGQPELKRDPKAAEPEGYDVAPVVFSREIQVSKNSPDSWTEIGFFLIRDGDTVLQRRGTKVLLQVVRTPEERAAAERIAQGYTGSTEDPRALLAYDEARRLNPRYPLAHQLYGELALQLDRPREAAGALKQLVDLNPADYEQRARYAHALLDSGRHQEALAQLADAEKTLKKKKVPARVWLYRARGYAATGNFEEADKALAKAGETIRISSETLNEINLRRMALAVDAKPDNSELRLSYARVLEGARRREDAVLQARKAVELEPGQPWGFLDLGELLIETGQREEGLRNLEHALKLAPTNPEAQIALAHAYRDAGRYADALPLYAQVAASQKLNLPVRHHHAMMLYATGKLPEARKELLTLVELARDKGELQDKGIPFLGPGILGSGLYFGPKKRLVTGFTIPEVAADVAILDALEDLEKHPNNPLLLQNIGAALLELNLPRLALETLDRSWAAGPLGETRYLMGAAWRELGNSGKAEEALRAAVRENPMHPRARLELAQLYTEAGELERAQAEVLAHGKNYPYDAPRRTASGR